MAYKKTDITSCRRKRKSIRAWSLTAFIAVGLFLLPALAQYNKDRIHAPAPSIPAKTDKDSLLKLRSPVRHTVPKSYEDLMKSNSANDLRMPSNILTVTEYDPETGCYIVRSRVGDMEITTPFILSPQQYNDCLLYTSDAADD